MDDDPYGSLGAPGPAAAAAPLPAASSRTLAAGGYGSKSFRATGAATGGMPAILAAATAANGSSTDPTTTTSTTPPAPLISAALSPGRSGGGGEGDGQGMLRAGGSALQASLAAPRRKSAYVCVSEAAVGVTTVGVLVMGALMIWYLVEHNYGMYTVAWGVGGIFVALTLPLAAHEIHLHCKYYVSSLQRHYVRIIAMPIIYAAESWLALGYHHSGVYLETARDLYEAYVIWSFYHLMLQFLGGKKRLAERLRAKPKERAAHLPPLCCLRGWKMGARFVHRNSVGVYQYVVLRAFTSIAMLIFEAVGLYDEGNWSPTRFYLYAAIIINVSQCYALYCLALFYMETRADLKPLSPLGKFAVVKAVVFFSWWQSIGIAVATSFGLVPPMLGLTANEVAKGLQNFLICIEMFIAAIAHRFFYSVTDFYAPGSATATPLLEMQRAEAAFVADQTAKHDAAVVRHTAAAAAIEARMAAAAAPPSLVVPGTPGGGSSASSTGGGGAGDSGLTSPPTTGSEVVPGGFAAAVRDVLPGDILAETGEHFRTGFGLLHKWEKRKAQAAEAAEKEVAWRESGVGSRQRPRSKFAMDSAGSEEAPEGGGGGDDAMEAVPEDDGGGGAESSGEYEDEAAAATVHEHDIEVGAPVAAPAPSTRRSRVSAAAAGSGGAAAPWP